MRLLITVLIGFTACLTVTCISSEVEQGEVQARKYCGTCHLFPEPGLLDKASWIHGIKPKMAFRMGMDYSMVSELRRGEDSVILTTIPDSPMLSEEDWDLIWKYYQAKAPDTLVTVKPQADTLRQFEPRLWKKPGQKIPMVTLFSPDTLRGQFWLADRAGRLFRMNEKLKAVDSFQLQSPVSAMEHLTDGHLILSMGVMDPNDYSRGRLEYWDKNMKPKLLIDSLQRPVSFNRSDLNGDGLEDIVICAFGNYTGALLVYEQRPSGTYRKHVVSYLPGARKVYIRDMDQNGLPDIVALFTQGDEQIMLLKNFGDFNFRVQTLLRFPSVYGSSYFEFADMNGDGREDIIYSNGDNADYSKVLKPYHGVRIFLSKGNTEFSEAWFYPMHGASQVTVRDFDGDGDLDLAASSFFPDWSGAASFGFVYLERQPGELNFKPYVTPLAARGRWMTMALTDLNKDRRPDLVLAALNFNNGVPARVGDSWDDQTASLLLLKNLAH
jgi:hypothetical protein